MVSRILVPIGARVRSARLSAGCTLYDVSVKTGLSEATLSRLENGKLSSARLTHVERIAEGLGVSPKSLLSVEVARRGRADSLVVRARPLPRRRVAAR